MRLPRLAQRRPIGTLIERGVREVLAGAAGRNYLRQHIPLVRLKDNEMPQVGSTIIENGEFNPPVIILPTNWKWDTSVWDGPDTFV